jgi:chaperonin cofactor prefoldin
MPLTSLETISQKLADVKSQRLEDILKISGSAAIAKNEYGVTVVDDTDVASTLLFKGLTKPKYDNEELLKAIDTNVKELKPNIPTQNLNLVPKPLYDEQVGIVVDLTNQVKILSTTVSDLNSQVATLQSQVQTEINNRLSIEQTNDALVNQIDTLSNTINDFSAQIGTSLQKSVDESILRASLQSQNAGYFAQIEALIKQIDSLNSIIDGLQSQLGAVQNQSTIIQSIKDSAIALGADVINKVGLVAFNPKADAGKPIVYFAVNNRNGDSQFKYGSSLSITNNDKDPISVELDAPQILFVPKTKYTISPSQTEKLEFKMGKVKYSKNAHSTNQPAQLGVKIIRNDGTSESKTFTVTVNIQHNSSYPSW